MGLKHISGWVQVTEPSGPSGPIDPGWGVRPPTDPGYGRPDWGGGHPDQGLPGAPGHPSQGPIYGGGHPGNKPPGRPIVPPHPDNKPPSAPAHPWIPGHWEPIDPGYGKPPIFGFFPVDPGWGISETLPPVVGGGPIIPSRPGGGQWVPTDPDYGKPVRPCPPAGGKPHPPIWAWVPDLPDFGGGGGEDGETVTVYPTEATVLASGGSGSFNVTLSKPGMTWQVAPTPEWVTCTPTGPQTTDVNVVYSASQNMTGLPRQALIDVNGTKFTLNQGAV